MSLTGLTLADDSSGFLGGGWGRFSGRGGSGWGPSARECCRNCLICCPELSSSFQLWPAMIEKIMKLFCLHWTLVHILTNNAIKSVIKLKVRTLLLAITESIIQFCRCSPKIVPKLLANNSINTIYLHTNRVWSRKLSTEWDSKWLQRKYEAKSGLNGVKPAFEARLWRQCLRTRQIWF